MARKTRRVKGENVSAASTSEAVYPTAIYARLSVENSGKDDEGAAIENQIDVCREYIRGCPDLKLEKVYRDNGWTGTRMHRPAFDEMMEDIGEGRIRAVVVRDLSRFARNYIETGTYLEQIFPELDVRFISVKEQFDTLKTDGTNESLMIPLQNLINDLYSKDISRKVEAALRVQMETGTFAWRQIPYGYRWNEDHSNIVPDEETAPYVRKMFQWRSEGISKAEIVRKLNECHAPMYHSDDAGKTVRWAKSTVFQILCNPAYAGIRVCGKRHSAIYKGIRLEKRPSSEWYVTADAHEALVTADVFETVRKMNESEREKMQRKMRESAPDREKLVDLFDGKIFCADCGYRLYFRRHRMDCKDRHWFGYYYCSSSQIRKHLGCTPHGIRQKVLEEKVFAAIQLQIRAALDFQETIRIVKNGERDKEIRDDLNSRIQSVTMKLRGLKNRRARLYEDYVGGLLDEPEYAYAREHYEEEGEGLNAELDELAARKRAYQEAISPDNKWVRMMAGVRKERKLTKELVDAVIEQVKAFEGGGIEIVMRYQDVYDLTKEYLAKLGKAGNGNG